MQDRRVWGFEKDASGMFGNGRHYAYQIYVVEGMWRSMDPDRMRYILKLMLGHRDYQEQQKVRIQALLDALSDNDA